MNKLLTLETYLLSRWEIRDRNTKLETMISVGRVGLRGAWPRVTPLIKVRLTLSVAIF